MTNPFLKRQREGGKNKHGTMAEKKTAKRLNMKLQPGSGALDNSKGDLYNDEILMELKTTVKDSIILKKEWLNKIYTEALEKNKSPALGIQFVNKVGGSDKRHRWVMIPENLFNEVIKNEIRK